MLTTALTPFSDDACSCQMCNFSLAYAVNNETVFMSRVGSHGNSNVFAERLITVMLVNEALQRAGAVWWVIPSTCARLWGDAWFRREHHSLRFWIMQPMKHHLLQQSRQSKLNQSYLDQIRTQDTVQGAALLMSGPTGLGAAGASEVFFLGQCCTCKSFFHF